MHRPTIGLIAIVLLIVGMLTRNADDPAISSACIRIGVIMTILWFAQPQLRHLPRWLIVASAVGLLVVLRYPQLLIVVVPIALVLWLIRPRGTGLKAGGRPPDVRR